MLYHLFVMTPWASPIFTIFSNQPLKKRKKSLHRTYMLYIPYLYTDQIPLRNSSDTSPKWPH